MQDEYVEYEECFEVGISLPDSVHSGPEINEDNSTVVCIKDDDSKSFLLYFFLIFIIIIIHSQ